jgi:trehalose 6-phosphate synthase/phosphatase
VAVPSRERIGRYRDLRSTVNELVGEINGDFGTPDWTPVVYIRRSVPRSQLVALYAIADLAWVTPLCDGMNLVAKEYVACQRGRAGVLLLSEFAGAAAEMGEAFLVNPYDEDRTACTVARALSQPEEERRERMETLYRRVVRNDAHAWSERYLRLLDEAAAARSPLAVGGPPSLDTRRLLEAYRTAVTRLLVLDYDGSLVPFAGRPRDATPPADLMVVLERLVAGPGNRVAILSGRPRRDLEAWFGRIPALWLAAEHGAILRDPSTREWQTPVPLIADWKGRVLPVLEHFVDRTPGSFVEEKEYALVWHHRMSDPEFGEWLANELAANLEEMLAETELCAVRGQKSIEVRLAWANKGEAALRLLDGADWGFVLGLGDDRTDEDLFERLPPGAFTVKVGAGPTQARFRLSGPPAVRSLLDSLASAAPATLPPPLT